MLFGCRQIITSVSNSKISIKELQYVKCIIMYMALQTVIKLDTLLPACFTMFVMYLRPRHIMHTQLCYEVFKRFILLTGNKMKYTCTHNYPTPMQHCTMHQHNSSTKHFHFQLQCVSDERLHQQNRNACAYNNS